MPDLRTLIDYATGENWELPLHLYERYLAEQPFFTRRAVGELTEIQYWLTTLTKEERQTVQKR